MAATGHPISIIGNAHPCAFNTELARVDDDSERRVGLTKNGKQSYNL